MWTSLHSDREVDLASYSVETENRLNLCIENRKTLTMNLHDVFFQLHFRVALFLINCFRIKGIYLNVSSNALAALKT